MFVKIICVGRNYALHAKELKNALPESPVLFMKPETALLQYNADFIYPGFSQDIHHEIELVLKINQVGKNIAVQEADNYFDEMTVGIDFTARDIQNECKKMGLPWEKAKAFDGAAVIGKFIQKTSSLQFHLDKNQQTVQTGNSADMIFTFDFLIANISNYFTLMPGDLIFTGTPAGVGSIQPGDLLEGYLNNEKLFTCNIA